MMPGPKEEAIYLTTRFAVDMSHSFPLATSAGGGGVRRVRINLDCKIDTNRVGSIYSRPGLSFCSFLSIYWIPFISVKPQVDRGERCFVDPVYPDSGEDRSLNILNLIN